MSERNESDRLGKLCLGGWVYADDIGRFFNAQARTWETEKRYERQKASGGATPPRVTNHFIERTSMKNSVIIVRGGVSYSDTNFGTIATALSVAKAESVRYPDAKVYCASSDRAMRIVQTFVAKEGRIAGISVRFCGKVVTSDDTIPDDLWDKFNEKR